MSKVEKFTPAILNEMREIMKEALEPFRQLYGLDEMKIGKMTYSEYEFRVPLEFTIRNADADTKKCTGFGYNQNVIGETITAKGVTWTVIDIDYRKPKFPIICKDAGDRRIAFTRKVKFDNPAIQYSGPTY